MVIYEQSKAQQAFGRLRGTEMVYLYFVVASTDDVFV